MSVYRCMYSWLVATLFVAIGSCQVPKNNPIVESVTKIGITGFSKGVAPSISPTKFKNSGKRTFVKGYIAALFDEKNEQEAFETFVESLFSGFEKSANEGGFDNDSAAALGFSIAILHSAAKGSEVDEEAFLALIDRFRAHLDTAAVRGASDRQKQEAYEWAICSAGVVLAAAQAVDGESKSKVQVLAAAQIQALLGAKIDQISIKGKDVRIDGRPAPNREPSNNPTPEPSSNGLAPGFSHSLPRGWESRSGWQMKSTLDSGNLTTAAIRFLPSMRASGNMGDALRQLWKQYVPGELSNSAGGMVYRRYTGNKLLTQFIFGRGLEKGRRSDTLFTIFLVDCGAYWQPLVLAQKYDSDTNVASIESQGSQYSYPVSASYAEEYMKSFQCSSSPNQALADRAALAGEYKFGSGSNMNYINIYTGATSMNYVSYGGTLDLKPDGTFSWKYSSASGPAGAANFRGAVGSGTWTIQGDILTCSYAKYDQGDGHFVKEHTYRIGGLAVFEGNVKVAILMSDLNKPVNCTTVGDSSQWYSTKK